MVLEPSDLGLASLLLVSWPRGRALTLSPYVFSSVTCSDEPCWALRGDAPVSATWLTEGLYRKKDVIRPEAPFGLLHSADHDFAWGRGGSDRTTVFASTSPILGLQLWFLGFWPKAEGGEHCLEWYHTDSFPNSQKERDSVSASVCGHMCRNFLCVPDRSKFQTIPSSCFVVKHSEISCSVLLT